MKDFPQSKFQRSKKVVKTALNLGVKEAGFRLTSPFAQNKSQRKQTHQDAMAKTMFQALGSLKGVALKAAQLLSLEFNILPPVYRKELQRACFDAPRLNRAVIRKAFMNSLNQEPEAMFAEFDAHAFAAASLGQVYAAVDKDKTNLAVKVQYPGIKETIDSDLDLIRALLKPLPDSDLAMFALGEIRERLLEEIDYSKELQYQEFFRERINHSKLFIPRPFKQYSSRRVLTTERIFAPHLDDWLKTNPPQEERNRYGQLLLDFFMFSLKELERIMADPNMGNYLFMPDGRLGIIDFGCVKSFDSEFSPALFRLINSLRGVPLDLIKQSYRELNFQFIESRELDEHLKQWCTWLERLCTGAAFDFGENRGYLDNGLKNMPRLHGHFTAFNRDFLFLDRNLMGVFRLLERMGAKVEVDWERDYTSRFHAK